MIPILYYKRKELVENQRKILEQLKEIKDKIDNLEKTERTSSLSKEKNMNRKNPGDGRGRRRRASGAKRRPLSDEELDRYYKNKYSSLC